MHCVGMTLHGRLMIALELISLWRLSSTSPFTNCNPHGMIYLSSLPSYTKDNLFSHDIVIHWRSVRISQELSNHCH